MKTIKIEHTRFMHRTAVLFIIFYFLFYFVLSILGFLFFLLIYLLPYLFVRFFTLLFIDEYTACVGQIATSLPVQTITPPRQLYALMGELVTRHAEETHVEACRIHLLLTPLSY